MPEYLAPGVYVEEVDTGPKPIEGVSTSTAGMVGVTEWGPENVATLVTGFADFQRQFGGYLDRRSYPGTAWYLPHAVEGFFTNGGKRLYVTRVLPDTATSAEAILFDRGVVSGAATRLASSALQGHTALILESNTAINNQDWLRLDDGNLSEYVRVNQPTTPPLPNRGIRALRSPLYFNHAAGATTPVVVLTMKAATPALSTTLDGAVSAGENRVRLTSRTNVAAGKILRIGAATSPTREFAIVASVPVDPADRTVTLRHPLNCNHPNTEAVELVEEDTTGAATQLNQAVNTGTAVLVLDDLGGSGADFDPADIVRIGTTTATNREYHVLADLRTVGLRIPVAFGLRQPTYADHGSTVPVQVVTLDPEAGFTPLVLRAPANAGARALTLVSRGNLAAGQIIHIGSGATQEALVIANVPTDPLDTSITVNHPLAFNHPGTGVSSTSDSVVRLTRAQTATSSTLTQAIATGQTLLMLADSAAAFIAGAIVEIGAATDENREYQILGNTVDLALVGIQGLAGTTVGGGVMFDHSRGATIAERGQNLRVRAIDAGAWGNCLRLKVEDETPPVLSTTAAANPNPGDATLTLASTVGIEVGTVLAIEFTSGMPVLRKVVGITGKVVTLSNSHTVAVAAGTRVTTREFRLTVECVQMNPLTGQPRLIASEVHRQLSMDPRHSRYVTKVVGAIFRSPTTTPRRADGRTDGESDLIRVEDALADLTTGTLSPSAELQAITNVRLGPDLIWEVLPGGRQVAVGRSLMNGDDRIGDVVDDTYIGTDATDPGDRTGLFALKNIDEISIVAIPGRTTQRVQEALINHCELLRYRFAVLDSQVSDDLAGVQEQRGLYDTKYAALYYPWLRIDDPFPDNPRITTQVSIPPSGHVLGIYARSDIERGVHKAPANETIRGISDLEVKFTKEEQDILNPRNINVLRNFRENNRGLRVWGARVLTSDPDWKYVNVRRLFIFIEKSIDRGTQWVVFEPNDEPLWQRVKRVITSFLTNVWRDGALMGRTPEEAFFVKCDRTTMTQNDIDNGRLIVQIGIAPVKPAEFVIFRIGQWVGGSSLEEG